MPGAYIQGTYRKGSFNAQGCGRSDLGRGEPFQERWTPLLAYTADTVGLASQRAGRPHTGTRAWCPHAAGREAREIKLGVSRLSENC